jgi:pilus assembly protein CpaE
MSNLLHVCLYNTDPAASQELTTRIGALNFVRFVAEVSTPADLAKLLHDSPVNLVFFHLDPQPAAVLEVIEQVSARFHDLALIAISHETGPEAILAPMRAGCDQFVCEPIEPDDLASAVSRVASRRLLSTTKSRCICVVGASGGVGATSIACNLSLELGHLTERDCGLVDLDLQFGNVAVNFDADPKYSIYDLAVSSGEMDRGILVSTLTNLPCKVSMLTRPEKIEQCEHVTPEMIQHVLELMGDLYENVVVDVPGHFDPQTIAAFTRADLILVVCQMLVPNIRSAQRLFEALQRVGLPADRIELVVNRSGGRAGRLSLKDVEETIRKPLFACIPNDYQFVARSIDVGRPIAALDPNNPVRSAIRKMAKKIIAGNAAAPAETTEARRGLFGRLLSR